jgi:hypothetical protein
VLQAATEVLHKALQTLHMKAEVRPVGGLQANLYSQVQGYGFTVKCSDVDGQVVD